MMRVYGLILLDNAEVIFRVYSKTNQEYELLNSHSATAYELDVYSFMELLAECFSSPAAQTVKEWKLCSRHIPQSLVQEISTAIGITIENISPLREQELLCKGMVAEL